MWQQPTIYSLAALLVLLCCCIQTASGRRIVRPPSLDPDGPVSVLDGQYIVKLRGPPKQSEEQHDRFRLAARTKNIAFQEHHAFKVLYHGLSLRVTNASDVDELASLPQVEAVYPVLAHLRQSEASNGQNFRRLENAKELVASVHRMTNVDRVHRELGLRGRGVKIGIIDSGIDYLHPAFSEPGKQCKTWKGDGCRVQHGVDFVGDSYDGSQKILPHKSAAPPMDCGGHGTHVAGIAAGYDNVITGVAPEATLGAYRVFGCKGTTSTDLIIKAMEQAYQDGMDIINVSIGGRSSFPDSPDSEAASRIGKLGVLVVASAGNWGTLGLFHQTSPALAATGFAVAAFENTKMEQSSLSRVTTNPQGGQPSKRSSWGPGADLSLKPDIAAPGGKILSAYPRKLGSYKPLSGTSMAAPYLAGCLALWVEQNKGIPLNKRNHSTIRMLVQNAGKPASMASGHAWPVLKQGAGLIDAYQFLRPSAIVSPSGIVLKSLKAASKRRTVTLTIRNRGPPQRFTLSHQPAESTTAWKERLTVSRQAAQVSFSSRTVFLHSSGTAQVDVTIDIGTARLWDRKHWQLSGYIVVTGERSGHAAAVHIPYHALKGDYSLQSIIADSDGAVLTDVRAVSASRATKASAPRWNNLDDTATFTLKDTSLPVLRVNTTLPTRLLVTHAYDSQTHQSLGRVSRIAMASPKTYHLPHANGVFGWDTTVVNRQNETIKLGPGSYYWKLFAAKPRAGPPPRHLEGDLVEVWRSPKIIISGSPTPNARSSSLQR
ncbi:hypothetical protein RI367_005795 [Sorochytrium milnesiophthora]